MSKKFNGLQAKVTEENKLVKWILCIGHSLNLIVRAVAECCLAFVAFFDLLEKVYVLCAESTNHSPILTETMISSDSFILVSKRVTTTMVMQSW